MVLFSSILLKIINSVNFYKRNGTCCYFFNFKSSGKVKCPSREISETMTVFQFLINNLLKIINSVNFYNRIPRAGIF